MSSENSETEIYYHNGDKYRGNINASGKPHGTGTYVHEKKPKDGDRKSGYRGDWEDGKKDGIGTQFYSNGDRYKGTWRNGARAGKEGGYKYANGDIYVGPYEEDRKHGKGYYRYENGEIYELKFKKGDLVKPGKASLRGDKVIESKFEPYFRTDDADADDNWDFPETGTTTP